MYCKEVHYTLYQTELCLLTDIKVKRYKNAQDFRLGIRCNELRPFPPNC